MPENSADWSVEFARPFVRDALARIIDESTPGLIGRMAVDPSAYDQLVAVAHLVSAEAEEILREFVVLARQSGRSWEQVGDAVGLSRLEAQRRFGPTAAPVEPAAAPVDLPPVGTRVTIDLSSDEMMVLNRAGNHGWHGVAFTVTTWTLEYDTQQWEHATSGRKEPAGEGWQRIGRWGPIVYWGRPTGLAPLAGNPPPHAFLSAGKLRRALAMGPGAAPQGWIAG